MEIVITLGVPGGTLYMEYFNRNNLFSHAHTNVNGFGKLENRIKSPASKHVGSIFRFITYLALPINALLLNPPSNKLEIQKYVQIYASTNVHFHHITLLPCRNIV